MTIPFLRTTTAVLACAAALAIATPAYAEMLKMKADLSGSNEVPPNDSKAGGSVDVTYDTASKKVSWNGTYNGLSGPATAAHFHSGEAAERTAGGRADFLRRQRQEPLLRLGHADRRPARDLTDGNWYVNIHTAAHKAGEIRGQVKK